MPVASSAHVAWVRSRVSVLTQSLTTTTVRPSIWQVNAATLGPRAAVMIVACMWTPFVPRAYATRTWSLGGVTAW